MGTSSVAGGIGTPANAPGANQGNVSGYDPVMAPMDYRSDPVNMISSVEMFNLPSHEFKLIKKTKSYPQTANGNYLRRYGLRNPDRKIAIKDEETGEIHWLPAARKKSFVEEYGLDNLKMLTENLELKKFVELASELGATPIEPTRQNINLVFNSQVDALEKSKKPAERGERAAAAHATLSGAAELEDLITGSGEDRDLASWVLGMQKKLADDPVSTIRNYDFVRLNRAGNNIVPRIEDFKFKRWTAPTPVPTKEEDYGGLLQHFDEEDPFELYASAIEHGGNLEFVEDRPKIERARAAMRGIMAKPEAQTQSRELAAKNILAKNVPLTFGFNLRNPGVSFNPKEIADRLRAEGNPISFRGGLGRYTGKRIREYAPAYKSYREMLADLERNNAGQENPEQSSSPKIRAPLPAKSLRRILTAGEPFTPEEVKRMVKSGMGQPITPEDLSAVVDLFDRESIERFSRTIRQ
jgi:hypothetical protein